MPGQAWIIENTFSILRTTRTPRPRKPKTAKHQVHDVTHPYPLVDAVFEFSVSRRTLFSYMSTTQNPPSTRSSSKWT
jgi:hypothetical protein